MHSLPEDSEPAFIHSEEYAAQIYLTSQTNTKAVSHPETQFHGFLWVIGHFVHSSDSCLGVLLEQNVYFCSFLFIFYQYFFC